MYKNEQEIRDAISKDIKVDWGYISKRLKLSEPFISKFADRVLTGIRFACIKNYQMYFYKRICIG